jgi:hypothetical protein
MRVARLIKFFHTSCLLGLLAISACATSATFQTHIGMSSEVNLLTAKQVEHISELRAKLRPDKSGSCTKLTQSGQTILVYVGDTNHSLISCLDSNEGRTNSTLRITSPGGNSDTATLAALYIRFYKMSVEVDGICFSSCALYIAPAARNLVILPLSFLGLHGAPELYSDEAAKRLEAEARALPNLSVLQVEGYVKGYLDMLKRTSATHQMIDRILNVGDEWFWLANIELPQGLVKSHDTILIPDIAMTQKCVRGVTSLVMWEAKHAFEQAAIKMIFPTPSEIHFVTLPFGNDCP